MRGTRTKTPPSSCPLGFHFGAPNLPRPRPSPLLHTRAPPTRSDLFDCSQSGKPELESMWAEVCGGRTRLAMNWSQGSRALQLVAIGTKTKGALSARPVCPLLISLLPKLKCVPHSCLWFRGGRYLGSWKMRWEVGRASGDADLLREAPGGQRDRKGTALSPLRL